MSDLGSYTSPGLGSHTFRHKSDIKDLATKQCSRVKAERQANTSSLLPSFCLMEDAQDKPRLHSDPREKSSVDTVQPLP